jgi:plasmid stabilization system protein ParE
MEYRVDLSPRALADIDGIVGHIHENSPHCSFEVRQTFVGRYRVLFTIRDEDALVYVLTVRHGARREMPPDELREADELEE